MAVRTSMFQPTRREFTTGIVILSAMACISMSRGTQPQTSSAATFAATPDQQISAPGVAQCNGVKTLSASSR